jgi:serine/threonine protein kinase
MIKMIGKGSFGEVMLVRKKDTKTLYAMKILDKKNIIRRNQVEHTITERRVLGRTKHPFIVTLHFAFQTGKKLYFVLDYCSGGELFFHLGRCGRLRESLACFYSAEITLALSHLHSVGIVYRDLKPENILLDKDGHVKLADFGLSKEGIPNGVSGTGSFCGTAEYLAPEILNRAGHGTGVDWWALGMVRCGVRARSARISIILFMDSISCHSNQKNITNSNTNTTGTVRNAHRNATLVHQGKRSSVRTCLSCSLGVSITRLETCQEHHFGSFDS